MKQQRQRNLALMRVVVSQMANRFPFFWGFMPPKWYYGPACSGKFWLLCDKYGGRDAQVSPSLGFYAPKGGKRPEFGDILCGVVVKWAGMFG